MSELLNDGPYDPAVLTTDAALLQQAKDLRVLMIEHAEADGDTSFGHMAACYALKAAVLYWVTGIEQECEVHLAQHVLLEETQQRVRALEADLAETKRPLDAQMARLNERVMTLNSEAFDRLAEKRVLAAALRTLADKTDELVRHLQKTGRLQPCFNLPALDAARAALIEVAS